MRSVLLALALPAGVIPVLAVKPLQDSNVRVGPAADDSAPQPLPSKKTERKNDNSDAGEPASNRKNPRDKEAPKREPVAQNEKLAKEPAIVSASVPASSVSDRALTTPPATTDAPVKKGETSLSPKSSLSVEKTGTENSVSGDSSAREKGASLAAPANASNAWTPPAAPAPTSIYRVGVGDVLDIRLFNQPARESTLFTVTGGGLIEYALAGDPINVAGMTTDEIGVRIASELRRRAVYDKIPQIFVSVREYASHAVLVSGLVNDPGVKVLRREAVPLYVIIAEAQPKTEAARALVMSHATGQSISVDLSDTQALNMLVYPSDVVTVVARPQEFFYIGGEVASPGQKDFHAGMTLTQAVLASGGATRGASGVVRVSRQGSDGRLNSTQYSLNQIQEGKVPDPLLRAGDRIEIERKK